MTSTVEEFEVVVVGAGPGGLAAGVTLGSYGVPTLIVEQRHSSSRLPKATVASTGTMELLRRWGLEQAAWERSIDVEWQAWACYTLAAADEGEAIDVGLPTRRQAELVSPTAPACLAQDELEPLMEAHLDSFASVRLERGVELTALECAADGNYILTISGPGERRREVHARYVIGADGMRSRVRAALGIATEGADGLAERVGALFRGPVWNLLGHQRYGIYFITREPEASFIPAGKPDRWIFGTSPEGGDDLGGANPERVKRWIREAAGVPALSIEIERLMPVTFGVGLADRFRAGNAFLIGDAAHRVTPRGGTGLNSAIRDGFDVGWKLAWVLRGWGDERLLESYERERRPVAEFNTTRSTRPDGSILGTAAGLNADIGGRIAHAWVRRDSGLVSTLDLLDEGLTLLVGPDWDGTVRSRDAGSPPMTVERLDAIAARSVGLTAAGSLLARPDGYPIALWNGDELDTARLASAIAAARSAAAASDVPTPRRVAPRSYTDAALVARAGSA
jgi:putative polyketide hydroxylase